ncbi:hypothetical protein KBD87_00905 [Candidatus Saccharibacteria bacterium]|nr:hypothetical protein [Candidatus Saccharibacteria bacterium]
MEKIFRVVGSIAGTLHAEARQLINRYFGKVQRFDGDAAAICRQIVDKLWQGDFYRTSLGHFNFFWMRDFGTACKPLFNQGHKEKIHHTLRWALRHYRKAGAVTTCIDTAGNCFDAPAKAIDTMPWLLHCLVVSHYPLNESERTFLEKMLRRYAKTFLNSDGSLKQMKVAEMRDAVVYDRSAYAVTFVARLARCAEKLQLDGFPFTTSQYRDDLLQNYWNGKYFNADRKTNAFSAECALFPFFMGIVDDKKMADKTLDYIHDQGLNKPYPLVYTDQADAFTYHWWMTAPFMPDYQSHSIWSWHGVFYLYVLRHYGRSEYEHQKASFARMIERHGTWPEMLAADGSWYNAPIYKGDPGMVWCALYLDL